MILAQGLSVLLLVFIASKEPRYAADLLISAAAVAATALATDVTDVDLLVGENLPFYAIIFILACEGALPVRVMSLAVGGGKLASSR